MMEFLLSKLWMFIAGVTVIAAVLAAFGSFNGALADDQLRDSMLDIRDALIEMENCPPGTMIRIAPEVPSGTVLRICNGSIWMVRDGSDIMLSSPSKVVAIQEGEGVSFIEVRAGQSFTAERRSIDGKVVTVVQLEKAAASSLIASTNLSASASLL